MRGAWPQRAVLALLLAAIGAGAACVVLRARLHALLRRCRGAPEHRAPHPGFAHARARPDRHRVAAAAASADAAVRRCAMRWWRSGLAGAIPSAACFVLAGTFLFAAARRLYGCDRRGVAAALLFALNPNMLYLQVDADDRSCCSRRALAALLWVTLWFRDTQSMVGGAGGRGCVERRVADALRRLVPDSVRARSIFWSPRGANRYAIAVRGAGGAGAAGLAGAQSVLLRRTRSSFITDRIPRRRSISASWRRAALAIPAITIGAWRCTITSPRSRWSPGWPLLLLAALRARWRRCAQNVSGGRCFCWRCRRCSMSGACIPRARRIFVPTLWPYSWYNTRYALAAAAAGRVRRGGAGGAGAGDSCARWRGRAGRSRSRRLAASRGAIVRSAGRNPR